MESYYLDIFLKIFVTYGWQIALIALLGVVILGVLKYCNIFSSIPESERHYIYIAISVGFSIFAAAIYIFICKGEADAGYLLSLAVAMLALNQAIYNIFKVTKINALARKLLDHIFKRATNKTKEKPPDETT